MPGPFALFAACQPGLEPLLAEELRTLDLAGTAQRGGVAFRGDAGAAMKAALWLGTASHVLVRVAEFRCRALGELQRKAAELPWRKWLRAHVPVEVRATTRGSRVYHTGAAEQRVRDTIAAAFGKAPPPPAPTTAKHDTRKAGANAATAEVADPREATPVAAVHVRFRDDVCTISLDATTTPLHRRGYRLQSGKAPLREDLAHALVLASGWRPGRALLDPFCGAGTIAIEAAGLARSLPPGRLRPPPLAHLAMFDAEAWQALEAARPAEATPPAPMLVSDRDRGAIEATRANAERAGVADVLTIVNAPLTGCPWLQPGAAPADGVLATNPPFGRRVAPGHDLLPLYQTLGHRAAALGTGWTVALLAHDVRLARRTALPVRAAFTTKHGGLTVTALAGPAVATAPAPGP